MSGLYIMGAVLILMGLTAWGWFFVILGIGAILFGASMQTNLDVARLHVEATGGQRLDGLGTKQFYWRDDVKRYVNIACTPDRTPERCFHNVPLPTPCQVCETTKVE